MEKPKVRFSQNSENAFPKTVHDVQEKGKVRVKSIVPINLPVKVLKNGKRLLLKDHKTRSEENFDEKSNFQCSNNRKDHDNEHSTISSTCVSQTKESCTETNPQQCGIASRLESPIDDTPANYLYFSNNEHYKSDRNHCKVANYTEKIKALTIKETNTDFIEVKSLQKKDPTCSKSLNQKCKTSVENNWANTHCNYSSNDEDIEVVDVIKNSNAHQSQHGHSNKNKLDIYVNSYANAPQQEDKENDKRNLKHSEFHKPLNKIKSSTNTKILKDATSATCNKNKKINLPKSGPIRKKIQVMPCAKFKVGSINNKCTDKQVKSQIKTRSSFNITGSTNNILVEPGMPDTLQDEHSNCNTRESYKNKDISSKNLLSLPEYNSTICTMKKMKEIEEERLIRDVESLPATYKNLVHGKISAALDFSPYESIYKNLINLSVDDDKLSTIFTRTKCPEPRSKDDIPKLSQFYNPKATPEHFELLEPQIFNPISVNTLNAFKISNKICTWRTSRDSL